MAHAEQRDRLVSEMLRGLEALGFNPERELEAIRASGDPARLEAFKKDVAKAFRREATKYHPDHGGDPEVFRAITTARDAVKSIEFVRPKPPPMPTVQVVIVRGGGGSFWYGSTASTSATTTGW